MLTSKSMLFNGQYIEDLIDGYTTLDVSGREATAIEVDSVEIGKRDGAMFRSRRYKSRTLTISFAIEGDDLGFNPDNTSLIEKMNNLNAILDSDGECEIIFADEPDKFYLGSRDGETEANMSLGVITGSFNILCSDPFKYSVEEYTAEPEIDEVNGTRTFLIDYEGTRRAYPILEAHFYTQDTAGRILDTDTNPDDIPDDDISNIEDSEDETTEGNEDEMIAGKGSCGYVAFFNERENVLQFGDPSLEFEPEDQEAILKKLVDQNFKKKSTWSTSVQTAWHSLSNNQPLSSLGTKFPVSQRGYFGVSASKPNKVSESISGVLLGSAKGEDVTYSLKYKAFSRESTSVKMTVTVTSSKIEKAIPADAVLTGLISIGQFEKSFAIKKGTSSKKVGWKKGHKISTSVTFTLSGITSQTDLLTNIKFRVVRSGGTAIYRQCTSSDKYKKSEKYFTLSGGVYTKVSIKESQFNSNKPHYYILVKGDTNAGKLPVTNCSRISIPTYIIPAVDSYYLAPADVGTYTKGYFHGPTVYRDIPADAAGDIGWADFTASCNVKISTGKTTNDLTQCGAFFFGVITGTYSNGSLSSPNILAGVIVQKTKSGRFGVVQRIVNGAFNGSDTSIDLTYLNADFGINHKAVKSKDVVLLSSKNSIPHEKIIYTTIKPPKKIIITKSGTTITFVIGRQKYTVKGVSASAKAYRLAFGAFAYSGMPRMDWIGVYRADFKPSTVGLIEATVPFTTGDDLIADSSNGQIVLNSEERPGLGALGNDWEQFYLTPGLNQIGTSYSEWCNTEEYRKCNGDDYFDENETYYTKSGDDYIVASIDETTFDASKDSYYVLESCVPEFRIRYREVFV